MSRQNVKLARRWVEAINRQDPEAIAELVHPDYELHNPWTPGGGVHRGVGEVRSFGEDFFDTWESFVLKERRIVEVGETVVLLAHARAEGKASGLSLDGPVAHLHVVRDGRLARTHVYMDHDEALRAAGLDENQQTVLEGYDAAERRDAEWVLENLDENVVWDMTSLGIPDLARVYRGHQGLAEFWGAWLAAWEAIAFRTVALESHGEHVVAEVDQRNRGRGSGAPVDFHYFQGFTVRGGRITASWVAPTRTGALAAVPSASASGEGGGELGVRRA